MEQQEQKVLKKFGRPSLYEEETVTFQVKVPKSKYGYIKELVVTILEKYKVKK